MNESSERLSATIDYVLTTSGFRRISASVLSSGLTSLSVYEDPYVVVGVRAFDTFQELTSEWLNTQERVIGLLTENITSLDAKSWDGYLFLVTPGVAPSNRSSELNDIRGNTRRLRKLVITGKELVDSAVEAEYVASVRRSLAPLLPLEVGSVTDVLDPLQELPSRLGHGTERDDATVVLEAYLDGRPLVAALHQHLTELPPTGESSP
jgi:hypothetical protein